MLSAIIKRLAQGVVVVLSLLTITFILIRLMPGDPFTDEKAVNQETLKRNREIFHLDKSIPTQLAVYYAQLAKGELGDSIKRHKPVSQIIKHSFPASLALGVSSMIIALLIGIPAGIISALKKNSMIDYGTMTIAMLGISIPTFVMGPLIAKFIATNVPVLKVAGWGDPLDWVLPATTLGLGVGAYLARITRGGMLEVLSQDYIRTARAKGLSETRIIFKHALKGGIVPAVAYVGPAFAALLTGSFIVETIFQVPGMGQHFVTATQDRDFFLLQGVVIVFGVLIVFANLLADIAQAYLNPRQTESI